MVIIGCQTLAQLAQRHPVRTDDSILGFGSELVQVGTFRSVNFGMAICRLLSPAPPEALYQCSQTAYIGFCWASSYNI
jgi:hypothetical protein